MDHAGRSDDLPDGAVNSRHLAARGLDDEVPHVAPVAIVVLGMRGYREADGVGRRSEPDLDGPSREIGAVDTECVLDGGFQRRMSRREEGENKGECVHGHRTTPKLGSFECRSPGPPPNATSRAVGCVSSPRPTATRTLPRCTAGPSKIWRASGAQWIVTSGWFGRSRTTACSRRPEASRGPRGGSAAG